MNPRVRNALFSLLLILALGAVWWYRESHRPVPFRLEGSTMATTYHVTYFDERKRNFQSLVDSLLIQVNRSINTYDSTSEISQFNRSGYSYRFQLPYFRDPLRVSQVVNAGSLGTFDPTVMPLVNAWGFGPKKVVHPDTAEVLAAREYVGFDKINFNDDSVWKSDPRVQLDFGGIGQGYGADVIADFLRSNGISDFFVELGGEGVASGMNLAEDRDWEIGVLDPNSDYMEQKFIATVVLKDNAFSTSGNYFNYRVVDGRKYSHTIDPVSGFPVQRELLSATVFAANCSLADAWATAFMCMGHEKGIALMGDHPELGVFFVFSSPEGISTFTSPGMQKYLTIGR
jgi:thiamine biosynthesis lipoprotein